MMSDVYAISNSNQVKSATENVGTYDNENPDIRFSANLNGEKKEKPSSNRKYSLDNSDNLRDNGGRKYSVVTKA